MQESLLGVAVLQQALIVYGVNELPQRLILSPFVKATLVRTAEELKLAFKSAQVFGVLIYTDYVSSDGFQLIAHLAKEYPKRSFIFCTQDIDIAVKNKIKEVSNIHLFWKSEEVQINFLLSKIQKSEGFRSRRSERKPIKAPVMVKASEVVLDSPTGRRLRSLIEGQFVDFSKHGAKICLGSAALGVKDYICLMYRKATGEWVSVESQVRWVEQDAATGNYFFGLQFIACL